MKIGEIILTTLAATAVVAALAYLAVFGRALNQDEDHLGIALSLPKVIIYGGVSEVGGGKLLTANRDDFIAYMKDSGFTFSDQLGAGYFFVKDGVRYIAVARKYSSHFTLFSRPTANRDG